ncbi:MAG: right-handed parallel beta-helix repeat-containing protein, partial [Myxococcota bacterium]|nr:right-handed parallel beta-helix repeat-containing protein [Myxococcota bacterium]
GGVGLLLEDATVTLERVRVRDTGPTDQGEYGRGLQVQGETSLDASDCLIDGNHDVGVVIEGATVTMTDCEVLDTRSNSLSVDGRGIAAFEGATLTLQDSLVQGNTVSGLYGQAATIQVDSVQFLDQLSGSDGSYGLGIEVWDGSTLEVSDSLLQGNRGSGVYVAVSSQVQFQSSQVLDTLADDNGAFGHGMEVQVGSTLTATDLTLEGNREVALYVTGSTASLQDCRIVDTQPNDEGLGLGIMASDAELSMNGTILSGNHAVGVNAVSSAIDMVDCEVTGTLPNAGGEFGRGINVYSYSTLKLEDSVVEGNREIGVAVTNSTASIENSQIRDTHRGVVGTLAVAVLSQKGAQVEARGLEVSDIEGTGLLVVEDSTASCEACTISRCSFAGGSVGMGELSVLDSVIENTGQDANAGGGMGLFASNYYGGSRLVVQDSTLRDNVFAGAYLEGNGSYQLRGNQLSGGQGIDAQALQWVHGDGVFVIAGEQNPTAWDETGETGVLISGNELSGNAGSGIFLDGASATLSDNTYQQNGVDLVQQRCTEVASPEGMDEEPLTTTDLCPVYDHYTSHPELHTYLTEAETTY